MRDGSLARGKDVAGMLNVPAPPQPQLDALAVCVLAAGNVVLGAALLLWGRILSRPFLALVGAVAAVAVARPLSQQFAVSPAVAGAVAALAFAAVGAATARIIWALAGGAVFGAVAVIVMLANLPAPANGQPAFTPVDPGLGAWLTACRSHCGAALGEAWKGRPAGVLWTLCLGGGVPLTVALLLPRLGKIFMTSLLGGVCIVGGVFLAAVRLQASLWPAEWLSYAIPITATVVLLVFGIIYQFCGEILAERAKKAEKAKADEKKEAKKTSDSAERKKR
jgi:hypothetical protein